MVHWKKLYPCALFSCHSPYCYAFPSAHQWIKMCEWQRRMKRGNDDNINESSNNKANVLAQRCVWHIELTFHAILNHILADEKHFVDFAMVLYTFLVYTVQSVTTFLSVTVGQTMLVSWQCALWKLLLIAVYSCT